MAFSLASGPGSRGGSVGHAGDVRDKDGRAASVVSLRHAERRLKTTSTAEQVFNMETIKVLSPNGSRLSCGRLARRRKGVGRQSVPARAQHSASPKAITARQLQALVRPRALGPLQVIFWLG